MSAFGNSLGQDSLFFLEFASESVMFAEHQISFGMGRKLLYNFLEVLDTLSDSATRIQVNIGLGQS